MRGRRAEADLRPGLAATAWSPSPARSTRSARSRATCADARCCSGDRRPRPARHDLVAGPVPDYTALLDGRREGLRIGLPASTSARASTPKWRRRSAQAVAASTKSWARRWRSSRCRTPSTPWPSTTSSPPAEASSNLARFDGVRYGLRGEEAEDVIGMFEGRAGPRLRRRSEAPGQRWARTSSPRGQYDAYYLRRQRCGR